MKFLGLGVIFSILITPLFATSTLEKASKFSGNYSKKNSDGKLLCEAKLSCSGSDSNVGCMLSVINYETGRNSTIYAYVTETSETKVHIFKSRHNQAGGHNHTIAETLSGEINLVNGKYNVQASSIEITTCSPDEFTIDANCDGMDKLN